MKKTKTLQSKVTEPFYDKLSDRASTEGVSLSSSINNHLEKSFVEVEIVADDTEARLARTIAKSRIAEKERDKNPLESSDMIPAIAWMYHKERNKYSEKTNIEEVKYYFGIIDKHIRNLNFEQMTLFTRVHQDLKLIIENYGSRWSDYINLSFTNSPTSGVFNFEAYDKLIISNKL